MGGSLFGKSNATDSQPIAMTLRVQSSVMGKPRPIGAGKNRLSATNIWYGNFQSKKAKVPGGKGSTVSSVFKGSSGYTYSVSFILSIGEGPIHEYNTIYSGNDIYFLTTPLASDLTAYTAIGINAYGVGFAVNGLPITLFTGRYPQAPWSYLTANFPGYAIGYNGEAIACFNNLGLGGSASLPNFDFEITWGLNTSADSPGPDVNPSDWISAFLTNADWGVQGFPAALLGDLTAYATFCAAYGLWISPVLAGQTTAQSHLDDLMKATASDFVWSQGRLGIGVYADLTATANGVTFAGANAPVYDLGPSDFLENQGSLGGAGDKTPIAVQIKDPSNAINRVTLEYLDRAFLYNPVPIIVQDDAEVTATGWAVPSDLRSHHFFCLAGAAMQSAALQLARERVLNTYQFTVGAMYALLDPLDIVTLTEPQLGFDKFPVRIVEIQENEDHTFSITAEDVPGTLGIVDYVAQQPLGAAVNALEASGVMNTPLIFEPPASLALDQIWIVASGASPTQYGGCNVWISTDGSGGNYAQVGQILGAARQGVVSTMTFPSIAANPSGLTIDNTNPLFVDMTETQSTLANATSADLNALITLCIVDSELIAYQRATLVGTNQYKLETLARGLYGTAIASHAVGEPFARLDQQVYAYPYSAGQVGATIWIKLQPFNVYGQGAPDLSTLTPFSHTIAGSIPTRMDSYTQTTLTTGDTTQAFTTPFASGPLGSPLPFVTITWSQTPGDVLNIVSVSLSQVVFNIQNAGVDVARSATIAVTGH